MFSRRRSSPSADPPRSEEAPDPAGEDPANGPPELRSLATPAAVEAEPSELVTPEAREDHDEQDGPWWLGPSDALPTAMTGKAWRRFQWEAAPDEIKLEWGSAVSNASKTDDPRYASPVELRFALENARWRIATYQAELESIDRRSPHTILRRSARPQPGRTPRTWPADFSSAYPRSRSSRSPESPSGTRTPTASSRRVRTRSVRSASFATRSGRSVRSSRSSSWRSSPRPRNTASRRLSRCSTRPTAAGSIAQLQAEFGDETLLRHRDQVATAVRAGEPYGQLRQMVAALEYERLQDEARTTSPRRFVPSAVPITPAPPAPVQEAAEVDEGELVKQ